MRSRAVAALLHSDRARQHAADQHDQAACGVIIERLGIGADSGMVEHRHAKQLNGGDRAGEGGEPEIQPQRREDDEDEIDHRPDEAERGHRPHAVDVQRQRDRRHRGLDERADIAPDHRQIAALPHVAGNLAMHPQLEQDERPDDRIEIFRLQVAVPDAAHRFGSEEVDGAEDNREQRRRRNQRLDAQQLGRHHFLHQRALEVSRHPRVLVTLPFAPEPHRFLPLSFRDGSTWNLEIPGSMLRIAPE